MDILCIGNKIFKLKSKSLIDEIVIGKINYSPEISPILSKLFEPLKEKYLKIVIALGETKDLKNYMSKRTTFELLDMIQLPTVIEQELISLPMEESKAKILNKFFTSILH